jgi:outer membrane receptor protein involved in Fe transport
LTKSTLRGRLMASSMITGVALATLSAGGALAQAAPAPAAAAAETGAAVTEFVVTGSRIPRPNLTSVSPVTTINSQAIKLQGTTNVEDLINNLPQAFADFGQFESNGSTGTATVDLRGLGNVRTLVLIDGKRLQPGDPSVPVADLNFIPPSLIERVEVLTGGASAVYGSDAVAGVVNFIMKHNFQGLQIDAETSIGEHNNNNAQVRAANAFGSTSFGFPSLKLPSGSVWTGNRNTVTITGGANSPDDKGNVEFYLSYTSIQPVLEAKYDWSTCSLSSNNTNTLQQYCGGSSTDATGRLNPTSPLAGPSFKHNFNILGTPTAGGLLPGFANSQLFNFAPFNYIQRPDIRYNAGEYSHYEINPMVDLYSSFMFMDDHTVAQIAASGSFYAEDNFQIPCNDPLLSSAQANTLCGEGAGTPAVVTALIGRRNVEGGGRVSDIEHMDYRMVFGSKGDLGSGWSYDISGQYGKSVLTDIESGYFLDSRLLNAINVVNALKVPVSSTAPNGFVIVPIGTPGSGPQCNSVIAGAGSINTTCVPYNIWSPGGVTPAALTYLNGVGINSGYTTEQVVSGSIAGDLGQYGMKSPMATEGAGISIGAEYRREFLQTSFDSAIQSGDLAGSGGPIPDTSGSQNDKDIFGEVRVPLVQNMPGFKDLTFEGGYRYSNYSSGGGNSTYKLGLDWQIVPDFKVRGSYERAVRAPNVQELFLPLSPGLVVASDPCGSATPTFTAAQCANTFQHNFPTLTTAQILADITAVGSAGNPINSNPGAAPVYGSITPCISGQCGSLAGGNPALLPETGKTWSIGAVFTPTFFRGFSLTVDYFNIVVDQAIVRVPVNLIFQQCALQGNPLYCADISRNAVASYAIFGGSGAGQVFRPLQNVGALKTSGVDVNADYRVALSDWHMPDVGSVDFNFTGTYVHNLATTILTETYDCAGLYGTTCGTPTPKWRHQLRVSWNTPWNLTLSANWRYLSPTALDFNTNQAPLQNGFKDIQPADAHIPAFSYFDLAFTYKLKDRYTFRGGVNNIFDRTPPLLDSNSFGISGPAFGNANTFPQVFDPLGRVLFMGLTADF